MCLSKKLKTYRKAKGFSQEQVALKLNVSRQAVGKWESGQSTPSMEHLLALSSLYEVPLEELIDGKHKAKYNPILRSNLTLIAIILQVSLLNVVLQPIDKSIPQTVALIFTGIQWILLIMVSIGMTYCLTFETNLMQRKKNALIECGYCVILVCVGLFGRYNGVFIGSILMLIVCMIYVFYVNPKYMNRVLVRRKKR